MDMDERAKTARRNVGKPGPTKVYQWLCSVSGKELQYEGGNRLLDIGCGYGQGAPYLTEAGWEWTGNDLVFREGSSNYGTWVSPLGLQYALEDGARWDVVALSNVVNVQRNLEELTELMALCYAALRPGGCIVGNYPATPRYLHVHTIGDLVRILEKMPRLGYNLGPFTCQHVDSKQFLFVLKNNQ